jgi:hypothetical protein
MATRLQYTVSPREIAYSTSDVQSVVTLTIAAANSGTEPVSLSRISVELPTAVTLNASNGISTNPSLAQPAPGHRTPWAVVPVGSSTWLAMPLPPVTRVGPGEVVEIVLSNIVVNEARGPVDLAIREYGTAVGDAVVTVDRTHAATEGGDRPTIASFVANPTDVGQGGLTTLSWEVEAADSLILQPLGIPLRPPRGTHTLSVPATTTFELQATGAGAGVVASVTVVVHPAEIRAFTAIADDARDVVRLTWDTEYATVKIGDDPVPASGTRDVAPTRGGVYTLYADGKNPLVRSATVAPR